MPTHALTIASENENFPSFPEFIASHLSKEFLVQIRPIIEASCEDAFQQPDDHPEYSYWKNVRPILRNRYVFERIHSLADGLGIVAETKTLDNGYNYLEMGAGGLTVHVKHYSNYQSLKEQLVKADYRRQMTTINAPFGQLPLFQDETPVAIPDEAFVILFYKDKEVDVEGASSDGEVGSVFFLMPSNQEGEILANCEIEDVIACAKSAASGIVSDSIDFIDLPPKTTDQDQEEAQ